MLHNVELGEGLLEDFEVVQVLIVKLGLPVDFGEWDFAGVDDVKELAIGSASPELLDFGVVDSEESVEPAEKFPPGKLDGII